MFRKLFYCGRMIFPALLVMLVAGGCALFLPAGEPPEGNIVDNSCFTGIRNAGDFRSRLVIRLTASAMMHNNFLPEGLYIAAADPVLDRMLREIAADAAATAGGFTPVSCPDGAWRLSGDIKEGTVQITLRSPAAPEPEWQECAPAGMLSGL